MISHPAFRESKKTAVIYRTYTDCLYSFLQTLFPLIACAASLLLLITQFIRRYSKTKWRAEYKLVEYDDPGPEDVVEEEEDDSASNDLTLQKTLSRRRSVVEIDKPTGQITLVAIEVVAILAAVGINLEGLLTKVWGPHGTVAAIAGLVSWGYIFCLASIRLLLSTSKHPSFPKIWNHTAALYGLQWLFEIFLFRSAIIHPRSSRARAFMIVEFSISSLLFLIALIARKGNKAVLLEYEDDLEPSREPLASLFSLMTFSWVDVIVWRGYRKTFEMADIWNLTLKDKAAYVLADFRQAKKTSNLAWRLLKYFKRSLLIQGAWAVFSNLFTFAPTLLLKAILEYMEDPSSTPANAAWLYVILLFFAGFVQAVADNQALWIGRKICIRLRAIIVGEIYAKALRRKAAATAETVLGDDKKKPEKGPNKLKKKILSFGRKKKTELKTENDIADSKGQSDVQANVGTIINLMAIDSFKVSDISAYLHFLWASVPVQLTIAIILLYKILGVSSFAGIGLMVLVLPVNIFIANQFQKAQKKIMAATDARIHSTNEVLQNIRIIKYFAWEQRFEDIVNEKRRTELKALRRRYIIWSLAATIWYGVPIVITFSSFFIYTVIEKKDLVPSVAFPALSMFSLLRVPLDQLADMIAHVQESKVSVDRVEEFLNEEETEKYSQLRQSNVPEGTPTIGLEKATLTWGAAPVKRGLQDGSQSTGSVEAFRLINVDVSFHLGRLNIIAGQTGSGKTSLLMALLGEMKLLEGSVHLAGGVTRETLRIDPETSLTESVAYCAQQAWLVNDTIKENILFASPYDARRYKAVIAACSLERDLEILDAGDSTLVGEKGITLSGGQKQRISLARAMYCNSRHLLLDDCLSAVDSHTAKHIFEEGIMGPLMLNRTCILVTHNVALAVPWSDYVVVLDNGKVAAQGPPEEIATSGALGDELLRSRPTSRGNSVVPSRIPSDLEDQKKRWSKGSLQQNGSANGSTTQKSQSKAAPENANLRTEGKASGSVKLPIIQMYLKAMGPWYYWIFAGLIFTAQQIGSVGTNVWIRQWANSYRTEQYIGTGRRLSTVGFMRHPPSFTTNSLSRTFSSAVPHISTKKEIVNITSVRADVDVSYYLGMYVLIGLAYILVSLSREAVLFWGSLNASWKIHLRLLQAVLHAKFKFFDSTPLGQLMNRFSKDVEAIDQELAPVAIGLLHCLASVITIVILISAITPGFLIAGIFISAIYVAVGTFYINSSRDLKRLESVQRSPLYQQFGETLSGVVTIRAYGDEARFVRDNHNRVNTHNRPFIYLWATNRWLSFRVDTAGALVAFFAGVFVIRNVGHLDAGAAGLSLTYAITFTENVLWLVRLYAANEQNMNSVERVKEYLDVEQEAKAHIPEAKPAANWPSQGAVQFIGYSTRYRSDLDQVLKGVTFSIKAGEKVGIVGRTGAGKSSLALALFRGLEAEEGKILVDDVDIGLIGLQDLREAITMVPQDPTLFTGTIRSNLDPFGVFTDEEIFTALRRVQLIGSATTESNSGSSTPVTPNKPNAPLTPSPLRKAHSGSESSDETLTQVNTNSRENKNVFRNLGSPVSESGSNLSQGQRQLLCLARALLKSPRVLLMDEATASIDYATDGKIQGTLRELKESTIITIAHRLQTIIDYDKVLVLDQGEVIEYDSPWELIKKEGGSFRAMCEMSGDMDILIEEAKKAWQDRRLVDDS